jgi:hypothetical protein
MLQVVSLLFTREFHMGEKGKNIKTRDIAVTIEKTTDIIEKNKIKPFIIIHTSEKYVSLHIHHFKRILYTVINSNYEFLEPKS